MSAGKTAMVEMEMMILTLEVNKIHKYQQKKGSY